MSGKLTYDSKGLIVLVFAMFLTSFLFEIEPDSPGPEGADLTPILYKAIKFEN